MTYKGYNSGYEEGIEEVKTWIDSKLDGDGLILDRHGCMDYVDGYLKALEDMKQHLNSLLSTSSEEDSPNNV